jgi:hypothetical protein
LIPHPHEAWAGHREITAKGLEVSFFDPYTGIPFGERGTAALSVQFADQASQPLMLNAGPGRIEITISSEVYDRARGAALVLNRCTFLRSYPAYYIAPGFTPKGAKDALELLLRWAGSLDDTRADLEETFATAGIGEPYANFSGLGSESQVLCWFALLAFTTLHLHDHILRRHVREDRPPRLRGNFEDAATLLTLMVVGAGMADQLITDLQQILIYPGTQRYAYRTVQLSMMLAMAFEIARDLALTTETSGQKRYLLQTGGDTLLPMSFMDELAHRLPGEVHELAHVSFLRGQDIYGAAKRPRPAHADLPQGQFEAWLHDVLEISEDMKSRLAALQDGDALERIEDLRGAASRFDRGRWLEAIARFNPLGSIGVDVFDTRDNGVIQEGGAGDRN